MRRAALLLVPLLLAACSGSGGSPNPEEPDTLTIHAAGGDATLTVEVADSAEERATGLMDRESLAADAGMVFVWDEPVDASFWMKDTLIPLSIAFWDQQGRIVGILDMDPCEADPCPTYASPEPYVGAVEVNQGWFASYGIEVGDIAELGTNA